MLTRDFTVVNKDAPIAFEYRGRRIRGVLSPVTGAAAQMWHFLIDGFYQGNLIQLPEGSWRYQSQKGDMEDMGEYFGQYLMAWYQ